MILLLNNIGSIWLLCILLFLVSQNRVIAEPYSRIIAFGYMLIAIFVAIIFFIRNELVLFVPLNLITAISKFALCFTLTFISIRSYKIHRK